LGFTDASAIGITVAATEQFFVPLGLELDAWNYIKGTQIGAVVGAASYNTVSKSEALDVACRRPGKREG
jgi:hypothetical protein